MPWSCLAEALRRAQREAIETPAISTPFHWEAFSLTGDGRQLVG